MKWVLAGLVCYLALAIQAGTRISVVTIDDKEITGIRDVHLGADGRVVILYQGGGTTVTIDKLPPTFLESWNVKTELAAEKQQKFAQQSLERAISTGLFREVDGVVYDLRKSQSQWVTLVNVKVFQIVDEGALAQPESSNPYSTEVIFIKNLPPTVGDRDRITVMAKLAGTYSYTNKKNDERVVRSYDVGKACGRNEIPEDILTKGLATARSSVAREQPHKNIVAPSSQHRQLSATGTGFFVTEDGYLVTNWHVVEGADEFKAKTKDGSFPAKLVASNRKSDLALLKVSGTFKPLPLSERDEISLGSEVFTIGFPNIDLQGLEPKYTDGKISSLFGLHDDPNQYQISVPVQPGNSGGPLIDRTGAIVGIVVARLNDLAMLRVAGSLPQNVNYAIKSKLVRQMLSQEPAVHLPKILSNAPNENIINSAQEAVALVLVY